MEEVVVLSPDVAAAFPESMGVSYDILRSHEEEMRTGFLGLRKQKVKVIDHLRLNSIKIFTMDGSSWSVPLGTEVQQVQEEQATDGVSQAVS